VSVCALDAGAFAVVAGAVFGVCALRVAQGVAAIAGGALPGGAVVAAVGHHSAAPARELHVAVRARLACAAAAVAAAVRDVFVARVGTHVLELAGLAGEASPGRVLGRAVRDFGHADVLVRGQGIPAVAGCAVAVVVVVSCALRDRGPALVGLGVVLH